ncbi:aspartate kinase [Thermohalobacter berrensis]|uniref:Aspartokinase n=1 Tax=Thermohalobacter berrensis TaxID=99594 RepID=A0A419T8W1_9FIRM|nr:aspartate kinase [Thermohalobacter berrensis]RKD33925.1 aspartate kinase [Thermohalobacter berrensis]
MSIVVQKYGGTSVATVEKIKYVARRLIERKKEGTDVVVVVSAMGKTTDKLINMAKEISNNPCRRELDMLLSTGEQVSISLLSMALKEYGYDSVSLTGSQAGIKTRGYHLKARIADIKIENIKKHLKEGKIVVVAGFQGVNEAGDITTLGRGGSDTTAVALAAKLNCPCEIYTDVDGVYSVDPRVYSKARKLKNISYEEMLEMASLGAGIMETRAMEIGKKYNVPIYIAKSEGNIEGTYIKELSEEMEEKVITGLTVSDDDLMVTINNIPYNIQNISGIFEELAKKDINIDMISQTAAVDGFVNVSFTAPKLEKDIITKIIEKIKKRLKGIEVKMETDITKISVIGLGMRNQSGVAARIFKIFADHNIEFKQVTTSEIRISYTINTKDKQKAILVIANEFNL